MGSPLKTANWAPPGGWFGSQQRRDDNSGSLDSGSQTATGKDSRSVKHANQYHPPHGYDYSPSQQPFPGALQFYYHPPCNMTQNSSQPTTSVSQWCPSCGPQWQGYDLPQGGYGESQMFPQQQFPGQGPSSPGTLRVPPGPQANNPVNRPTSSSFTPPPRPHSGAPGRPPISFPTGQFLLPVEPRNTDVARIVDLPQLPQISYNDYDADDGSDDLLNLGGAEGKPPVSLKQTKFSLKQFAKWMGQANYSAFINWIKVRVAGFLEKNHQSIIWGQNCFNQLRDGPLHWKRVVADFLETFESWLPLDNFNNARWICRQWVEKFLKKCASKIWEDRKKGMWGKKQPTSDLGESMGEMARSNLPELQNTMFMVMIRWVWNGNNVILSPHQLQASYTSVSHWEELIDFINTNRGPKEPYIPTSQFKCTLEQDELDKAYMGLYTNGQLMMDPIYGQILYNCCLSNAFKLKLGHNVKMVLVEMKQAMGRDIAEHVIRPPKVMPASSIKARCGQQRIIIDRLWNVLKRVVEEMNERKMVGKRMILVLM